MNFCKGQNAFSDIPGFDASKGERIVRALQRLYEKIEYLEQTRFSEKKSTPEGTNSKDEDLTMADIQYMLLVLQLKYVRSLLKKRVHKNFETFHSEIKESNQNSDVLHKHSVKSKHIGEFKDNSISQKTAAEKDLAEELCFKSSIIKDIEKSDTQISTDDQLVRSKDQFDRISTTSYKTSTSKPHYHLKLDDVPFILGASTTASHSVIANVQNIIAMMKSHHKVLCGPKQTSKPAVKSSSPEDAQDATKMLNDLSKDLYELALKQHELVKSIDAAQGRNLSSNSSKNFQKNHEEHPTDSCFRRLRSNSESEVKLHAEVKDFSKHKTKESFIKCNEQQKQSLLSVRSQSSNLSIMDRRKLLRSLQNFKTHLSEEDISWD